MHDAYIWNLQPKISYEFPEFIIITLKKSRDQKYLTVQLCIFHAINSFLKEMLYK